MKFEVLWRFQGCHFHNNDCKFEKENKLMTLDVLQSSHNKPLRKKLEERPISKRDEFNETFLAS
jgi:hypothetical protein